MERAELLERAAPNSRESADGGSSGSGYQVSKGTGGRGDYSAETGHRSGSAAGNREMSENRSGKAATGEGQVQAGGERKNVGNEGENKAELIMGQHGGTRWRRKKARTSGFADEGTSSGIGNRAEQEAMVFGIGGVKSAEIAESSGSARGIRDTNCEMGKPDRSRQKVATGKRQAQAGEQEDNQGGNEGEAMERDGVQVAKCRLCKKGASFPYIT